MNLFLGSHQNRLDAKGRVSIPANFRLNLRKEKTTKEELSFILRPSHTLPCIEGWPFAIFNKLTAVLDDVNILSTEHNDLATLIYAQAWHIEVDREGRIILPDILKQHANLTNKVTFMGLGTIFQIWEPVAAQKHYESVLKRTKMVILPHAAKAKTEQADQ